MPILFSYYFLTVIIKNKVFEVFPTVVSPFIFHMTYFVVHYSYILLLFLSVKQISMCSMYVVINFYVFNNREYVIYFSVLVCRLTFFDVFLFERFDLQFVDYFLPLHSCFAIKLVIDVCRFFACTQA